VAPEPRAARLRLPDSHVAVFRKPSTKCRRVSANGADAALDPYLPMIYVNALQEQNEENRFISEGFQQASISMRCFQTG
jgi:hypothetical protein